MPNRSWDTSNSPIAHPLSTSHKPQSPSLPQTTTSPAVPSSINKLTDQSTITQSTVTLSQSPTSTTSPPNKLKRGKKRSIRTLQDLFQPQPKRTNFYHTTPKKPHNPRKRKLPKSSTYPPNKKHKPQGGKSNTKSKQTTLQIQPITHQQLLSQFSPRPNKIQRRKRQRPSSPPNTVPTTINPFSLAKRRRLINHPTTQGINNHNPFSLAERRPSNKHSQPEMNNSIPRSNNNPRVLTDKSHHVFTIRKRTNNN